jgi:preprotein translocase subunit SecF
MRVKGKRVKVKIFLFFFYLSPFTFYLKHMIDWMKYRLVYFIISGTVITVGVLGLVKWKPKIGVDFVGGAQLEYRFSEGISENTLTKILSNKSISVSSIQKTSDGTYIFKLPPIDTATKDKINKTLSDNLKSEVKELSFENLGPSVGSELVKKTIYALIFSTFAILFWIAYQFKSLKFGISATLATLHDTIVLVGTYSLLGYFWGAEFDFLFVTAMLTILSFSVHDTIVVFDRIREQKKRSTANLIELSNNAMTETMVRSLNNSFTIIFMLIALILLGGTSIKWFAAALLIGTVSGTYSSPFVALPILVTWDEIEKKIKSRKR